MNRPLVRGAQLVDAPEIARVHVEAWRETYAELVDEAFATSFGRTDRLEQWLRVFSDASPADVFVAEAENEIVGFASAGPIAHRWRGFDSELYTLYVLRAFHGRGIGRALVAAAGMRLRQRGRPSAVVAVLRQNENARRFYERLGAREFGTYELNDEGRDLPHVMYGWKDLGSIEGQTTKRPE